MRFSSRNISSPHETIRNKMTWKINQRKPVSKIQNLGKWNVVLWRQWQGPT